MKNVRVERVGGGDPLAFDVAVGEGAGATLHRVSLAHGYLARLPEGHAPERLVEAAFRFLLDREPKEAILRRFDLSVISRYFPEFEAKLPEYVAGLSGPSGRGGP